MLKKAIVVIDDENINLRLISGLLDDTYHVHLFNDGDAFLNHHFDSEPLLILLDILMPKKSGFDVIKEIKNSKYSETPVIFLTAKSDAVDEKKGIELGAVDYITKPFSYEVLKLRVELHIKLLEMRKNLQKQNHFLHQEVENRVKDFKVIQDLSLSVIAQIVEQRDLETANHIYRTYAYVNIISNELSQASIYQNILTQDMVERISKASILHDIGKVAVPDHILMKPGKLTTEEFDIIKEHVRHGKDAIDKAINLIKNQNQIDQSMIQESLEFFQVARDIAFYHHERYDGKGYLVGLSGTDIPLAARIMSVADVFDALVSRRVYKKAWDFDQAMTYIKSESGHLFDPIIVEAFLKHKKDIFDIYITYSED